MTFNEDELIECLLTWTPDKNPMKHIYEYATIIVPAYKENNEILNNEKILKAINHNKNDFNKSLNDYYNKIDEIDKYEIFVEECGPVIEIGKLYRNNTPEFEQCGKLLIIDYPNFINEFDKIAQKRDNELAFASLIAKQKINDAKQKKLEDDKQQKAKSERNRKIILIIVIIILIIVECYIFYAYVDEDMVNKLKAFFTITQEAEDVVKKYSN